MRTSKPGCPSGGRSWPTRDLRTQRNFRAFIRLGRLAPGVTIDRLQSDLSVVARRIEDETPQRAGRR